MEFEMNYLDDLSAELNKLPPEQLAAVERIAKDPGVKALVYLLGRKFPYEIISKMTTEQKLELGAVVAGILDESSIWSKVTKDEPLVLSKP